MQHTHIRPGVVKRSRLATVLRRKLRERGIEPDVLRIRWTVWCRFGTRPSVECSTYTCPHTARAECKSLNRAPSMRAWVERWTERKRA